MMGRCAAPISPYRAATGDVERTVREERVLDAFTLGASLPQCPIRVSRIRLDSDRGSNCTSEAFADSCRNPGFVNPWDVSGSAMTTVSLNRPMEP